MGKFKLIKISEKIISNKIYVIRSKKVMVDRDLATLYGVETKYLSRQVKRNIDRFPEDFMLHLTKEEFQRCQIGTFGTSKKGSWKYLPYVFTEQGIAMLSSVLNSERAIQVNIQIMRTFTKFREYLATHENFKKKIEAVERKFEGKFKNHDRQFQAVFEAIRQLVMPPSKPRRKIGFHP